MCCDRFLLSLLLRFGNIGDHLERKLLGPDVVAVFRGVPAQRSD